MKELIPEEGVDSKEMESFIGKLTPGHVLAYATGASQTPAAGFTDKPKITFIHDDEQMLPRANTCSCELMLFVNNITVTQEFLRFMVQSLMNGVVFSTL